MSNIFGIVSRDKHPVPATKLQTMQTEAIAKGCEVCKLWTGDGVGLGWTSETIPNKQTCANEGIVFIASGRIDNVQELGRLLQIPDSKLLTLTDGEVLRLAYLKWGNDCCSRVFGDWSFAAWHQNEHRLVLSRDHHGNTSLYYYVDSYTFVFATSLRAILALNLTSAKLDELYLAQYLTSWMGYHGERTPNRFIRRLPPAHTLCVTQDSCTTWQYWHLEDTPELHLPNRREYLEAFVPIFEEAVRCRIKSDMPVACTLSGGLDSSSVAVTAAGILGIRGQRMKAFTSVPLFDTTEYIKTRFADEFPYAKATALQAGNIDLFPVNCSDSTPISTIRRALQITPDLCYGAVNLYWIMEIQKAVRAQGCDVLMTGAIGNGGVSWDGEIFSQPCGYMLEKLGWRGLIHKSYQNVKKKILLTLPLEISVVLRQLRMDPLKWLRMSAINPDFASRIRLIEHMLHDPEMLPAKSPKERKMRYFLPGKSMSGAYMAELDAAYGIQSRDPTADARVLAFTCSVPDRIFIDPHTDTDRWLIREAMKGRLPESVRLNRNRGVQAGDIVPRLRASALEVENALNEIAKGPGAEYVDVAYMRAVWQMIQTQNTPVARFKATSILLRGIMTGMLVNQFYE